MNKEPVYSMKLHHPNSANVDSDHNKQDCVILMPSSKDQKLIEPVTRTIFIIDSSFFLHILVNIVLLVINIFSTVHVQSYLRLPRYT